MRPLFRRGLALIAALLVLAAALGAACAEDEPVFSFTDRASFMAGLDQAAPTEEFWLYCHYAGDDPSFNKAALEVFLAAWVSDYEGCRFAMTNCEVFEDGLCYIWCSPETEQEAEKYIAWGDFGYSLTEDGAKIGRAHV